MASSSNPSPQCVLAFGLEMEFLIRPKASKVYLLKERGWNPGVKPNVRDEGRKAMNRTIMREKIAHDLRDNNVRAGLTTNNYDEWTIVDERSLDEMGDFLENWQHEVDLVFDALNAEWEITLTTGCAMHVHVSTGTTEQDRFTMDQVRRLLKAIAIFDDAITKIMPAHRKNNEWAMSNLQGREAPADLKQRYAAVPTRTWAPLFSKFDKIKMKQMVFIEMGQNRSMSWNFSNLVAQCGTVEFRRPPSVRTAAEARHWAGVALGFVSQAIATDFDQYTTSRSYLSVGTLANFLTLGIKRLDGTCRGSLNEAAIKEDRSNPTVYTASELQAIANKKAEKTRRVARLLPRPTHVQILQCPDLALLVRVRMPPLARSDSNASSVLNTMERALLIPELLESISLHLDMSTLLVSASRVNKTWHAVINRSVSIQRALYFQPILMSQQSASTYQPIVNPLLKKHFGGCFFDTGNLYGYLRRANSFYTMPCAGASWEEGDDTRPLFPRGPEVADMTPQKIHEVEVTCRKFTRKEATWRKMLVSQPPPPCLGFLRVGDVEDPSQFINGPYWVQTTLLQPETDPASSGLCMGTLYDVVQYHTGHHTRTSMWFRVVWDQAREPYGTPSAMECCRRLLQRTNVVVEFYHTFDPGWVEHREPLDLSLFDKRFRSEVYRDIDISIDEETFEIGDVLAFDRSFFLR
ncbi:hypothetical protein F4779DRAFT_613930 [Xylariaceae sp. FL0662B]|nr:hypothetical protein F4779DRAFT_613930 [Xylariaceae sp. FL0662B]